MLDYEFTKKARRRWRKFPPDIKERIILKINEYCSRENIFDSARHLGDKFYRFRVGDYRVIFKWEGENILITKVDHRGERGLYKKFFSLFTY